MRQQSRNFPDLLAQVRRAPHLSRCQRNNLCGLIERKIYLLVMAPCRARYRISKSELGVWRVT